MTNVENNFQVVRLRFNVLERFLNEKFVYIVLENMFSVGVLYQNAMLRMLVSASVLQSKLSIISSLELNQLKIWPYETVNCTQIPVYRKTLQ